MLCLQEYFSFPLDISATLPLSFFPVNYGKKNKTINCQGKVKIHFFFLYFQLDCQIVNNCFLSTSVKTQVVKQF